MRKTWMLGATVAAAAAVTVPAAAVADGGREACGTRHVTITVTNNSTTQPFSPGAIVTHALRSVNLWDVGAFASDHLRQIAESGKNAPMLNALGLLRGVCDVAPLTGASGEGPILPGESATFTLDAGGPFNRISLATMLVQTNDGFTGLDGERIRPATPHSVAYDAGTELNTEDPADLVLTGTGHTDEGGLVTVHPGDTPGVGVDLPWAEPVASYTIEIGA